MSVLQRQTGKPTIGFLFGNFDAAYMRTLWAGMVDTARMRGAHLLCFKGESLQPAGQTPPKSSNILYALPSPELVDGLILTGVVGVDVGHDEWRRFCASFSGLPVLTLGGSADGFPAIEVDNAHGIRELVRHQVEIHGHRRIGFIQGPSGNADAELRYRAYADALEAHGVAVDPALVLPGDFTFNSGRQAIQRLFSQPGVEVDAILAANDLSALGAMEALAELGRHVPDDVAVVGFDDQPESRAATPPLTTVRQPVYAMGVQAVERMLRMLKGERDAETVTLPTMMVARQSCGCANPAIARVVERSDAPTPDMEDDEFQAHLLNTLEDLLSPQHQAVTSGQSAELVEALFADCGQTGSSRCLALLYHIFEHSIVRQQSIVEWHDALSALRRMLLDRTLDRAVRIRVNTLFQQARILLGEMMRQAQGHTHLDSGVITGYIRNVARELNANFHLDQMRDILARALRMFDIPRGYVMLYDTPDEPLESAHLVFAYDDGRLVSRPAESFSPKRLFLDQMEIGKHAVSFMVEALYLETRQIGLALFEIGPSNSLVYEMLRTQVSSSLHGAILLQRQREARQILEVQPIIQQVLKALEHLTATSDTLTEISADMASGAEEISHQVTSVSKSSEHISDVIQNVSAAAAQEAASITEIASTVDRVMDRVNLAVESARNANATMTDLSASSRQVGEILDSISGVAKQTKFLALYAAIIAAQSGSFESNFSVVATEVKTLAQETANSAKDVAQKIRMIQLSSQDAVEAISRVVTSIYQVSEHSGAISTAITEQSSTTSQISRTIADAADQSHTITQSTAQVASVAQEASLRAVRVEEAARNLLEFAEQLQQLVTQFTHVSRSSEEASG